MTLSDLLKDYGIYNHWANTEIVLWLKGLQEDLLEAETPSSFPTLKGTLLHIWSAETIWLSRLEGVSPNGFPFEAFDGTLEELFDGVLRCSGRFRDFLDGQSPDFFENRTAYTHTSGKHYNQVNAEIILHCLQHSTYHRGQIITMARALDATDIPHTDYILYVRNKP